MLTIYDLDEKTIKLYDSCQQYVGKFVDAFSDSLIVNVSHGEDIASTFDDSVILVMRGIFKMFFNDKFIRIYKMGDVIASPVILGNGPVKIISEMASDVKKLSTNQFIDRINTTREKCTAWFEYSKIQYQLMAGISSSLINNDKPYDINLKVFNPGDLIIREGEAPDCLYEMVDGDAIVSIGEKEIGRINRSEIFGEVSFLTGSNRIASVIANSTCMVQCINGEHFHIITRQRPALVIKMAQTIAQRLADVNMKYISEGNIT